MNTDIAIRLEKAVVSLCPDVQARIESLSPGELSEHELRRELVCCILSSQVPYEHALFAASQIDQNGLLDWETWNELPISALRDQLCQSLTNPMQIGGHTRHYRFSTSRASQIAKTSQVLRTASISLANLVYGKSDDIDKRRELVSLVCGFGLKQASMFLRNVGATFNLAVIDRHVTRYMEIIGLTPQVVTPLNAKKYESMESKFRDYADRLGCRVGYLDWSIWVVMRVAKEESFA